MIAAVVGDHRQLDAHPRASLDVPASLGIAVNIFGVIEAFIFAADDKTHVERVEVQVGRGIAQAQAVVQATRAFLADNQVFEAAGGFIEHIRHRDEGLMALSGAPAEFALPGIGITQPDARHKIGRLGLVGIEIAVEREQHENVLLGVAPTALGAMGQQAIDQLGDQVALWIVLHQRFEQDGIGAAVGIEQQVALLVIAGGEIGSASRFDHAIGHKTANLVQAGFVFDNRPQPANGRHGEILQSGIAQQVFGFLNITIPGQVTDIQRISAQGVAGVFAVPVGIVVFNLGQVSERVLVHGFGHIETLQAGAHQGMGHMHGVERAGFKSALPVGETAIVILHPLQAGQVTRKRGFQFGRFGQAVSFESGQDIAQGGNPQDARGQLLGAFVGILHQVQDSVRQGLQSGRGGRNLQAAILREDSFGILHRLGNSARINHAVSGKGLGRGRGIDRQLNRGRVSIFA